MHIQQICAALKDDLKDLVRNFSSRRGDGSCVGNRMSHRGFAVDVLACRKSRQNDVLVQVTGRGHPDRSDFFVIQDPAIVRGALGPWRELESTFVGGFVRVTNCFHGRAGNRSQRSQNFSPLIPEANHRAVDRGDWWLERKSAWRLGLRRQLFRPSQALANPSPEDEA